MNAVAPGTPVLAVATQMTEELRALGIQDGDLVCLHASLSSLGMVIGGFRAVIEAVVDAVGDTGTVAMPSYSGDLSDSAEWRHPPIPAFWIDDIRTATPAYDPARTPTRGMGAVAEYFRTYPGTRRSDYPQSSFAARGPKADDLLDPHPLDFRFGPDGPLGGLGPLAGKVVLLGAPHDTVSLFHLTQHMVGWSTPVAKRAPVESDGVTSWVGYQDVEYPLDWFEDAIEMLLGEGVAVSGQLSAALTVIFSASEAVERVVEWRKEAHR